MDSNENLKDQVKQMSTEQANRTEHLRYDNKVYHLLMEFQKSWHLCSISLDSVLAQGTLTVRYDSRHDILPLSI
jgi:hypothetical protein